MWRSTLHVKSTDTIWRSASRVKITDPHALSTPQLGTQEIALTALASALGRRGGRARLPQALYELCQRLRLKRAAQRGELGRVGRQRDEGWVPVPARAPGAPSHGPAHRSLRAAACMHASAVCPVCCCPASGISGYHSCIQLLSMSPPEPAGELEPRHHRPCTRTQEQHHRHHIAASSSSCPARVGAAGQGPPEAAARAHPPTSKLRSRPGCAPPCAHRKPKGRSRRRAARSRSAPRCRCRPAAPASRMCGRKATRLRVPPSLCQPPLWQGWGIWTRANALDRH